MNKKKIIMDQLKKISAQLMRARIDNTSQVDLKNQFYKLSREYKKYWEISYDKTN